VKIYALILLLTAITLLAHLSRRPQREPLAD